MSAFLAIEALSSLSPQALGMVAHAARDAARDAAPDSPTDEVPESARALRGQPPTGSPPGPAAMDGSAGSFGRLVVDGLAHVNSQLIGSQVELQKLALGDAANLHQIMINLEESRLSLQLMMQVRSRLLEAYQDVMKMPI